MKTKHAAQMFKAASVNQDEHTIRFIMSTPDEDRHGEKIDQNGWDFKSFEKNPVVLWGHDHNIPAIGKVFDLAIVNGNTEGIVKFAYDENPLAKTIFDLCAGGYINAVSVGFRNKRWEMSEDEDTVTLLENELYELSIVNIPANQFALAKSKGVDMEVLERFAEIEQKAVADRVSYLGIQVTKDAEETPEVVPGDGETTPEVTGEEVVTETATAKTDEEIAAEEQEGVEKAIAVIAGSSALLIQKAMKALQDADKKAVEITPAPKAQGRVVKSSDINRALRQMLKSTSE